MLPTPVKWDVLQFFLEGYDSDKTEYLVNGFRNGFQLHYEGERDFQESPNLKSAVDNPEIVGHKLQKELALGRIAGPFLEPPFPNLKISPIGVVPKKAPNEFRMIHHLSYPKNEGISVNDGIPREYATVSYASVDDAIKKIVDTGRGAFLAKTDIESAFRIIPMCENDYPLLGFKWEGYYYHDRSLPMGSSSSCKIFEGFSTALEWIATNKFGCGVVIHILDDFLLVGQTYDEVYKALESFKQMCLGIGVPLSKEKTFFPSRVMTFMGISLHTEEMEARLPEDKLEKGLALLTTFQSRKSCTLKDLLSLIGFLNFTCIVVRPGRTFLRRLINLTIGITKLYYHCKLNAEAQLDISLWFRFLREFNGRSMFMWTESVFSSDIQLFTDASAANGYGAVFKNKWFFGRFPSTWKKANIAFLELYPIVTAALVWGEAWKNHKIIFVTDNQALVAILNQKTSKLKPIMHLVRILVLHCLRFNIEFKSRHIPGQLNCQADALSRLQVARFKELAPNSDRVPTEIPFNLLPENLCKDLKIC